MGSDHLPGRQSSEAADCPCGSAWLELAWAMASEITPEYLAALRKLDGPGKLRTAAMLYWGARKIKAARLRELHPDWTEGQVQDKVKKIFLHAAD